MSDAHDHQSTHPGTGTPIDEGMRQWYESCPCCMSQAYPDVKQALDEERAARSATSAV
ncbi:MAG: hypothetical protein ACRD0J_04600 [Acidimicrobiales bacterium]